MFFFYGLMKWKNEKSYFFQLFPLQPSYCSPTYYDYIIFNSIS